MCLLHTVYYSSKYSASLKFLGHFPWAVWYRLPGCLECWQRDEKNTDSIILFVVPSDRCVWVGREGAAALILYSFCESIETLGREGLWLSAVLESVESSQRKSAQILPLPDVEPDWTRTLTGVWTRSFLLNMKHIWSSVHPFVLADMLLDTWWALCWSGSFWWAFCNFQTSHVVEVIKSSHSFQSASD